MLFGASLDLRKRACDRQVLSMAGPTAEILLPDWNDGAELWIFEGLPEAVDTIRLTFGFAPAASIGLDAWARGRPSDHVFARLAADFLRRQEGALLFHGLLSPSLNPLDWREQTPQQHADDFAARRHRHCI